MSKRSLVLIAVVWLIVLIAGISSAATIRLSGADQKWSFGLTGNDGVLVSQEEYETLKRYSRLEEVRRILAHDYYMDIEDETLVTGAVRGMMDSLGDHYTFYYTPEEMAAMTANATGAYKGIGIEVHGDSESGDLIIYRVFEKGPAARAGLEAGDILVEVGGEAVSGETPLNVNEAVSKIQSFGDGAFTLTLRRDGEMFTVTLRCEDVVMDRVAYRLLDGDIGYIQITDFLGNDVEGFKEAMASFANTKLQGLIIDLRDNTGGYLDDVVEIADALLPEGLIVYTEDRYGNRMEEKSDAVCAPCPVVCLVNRMSASASEVLAGAVQDYGIGAIIGETTFGKGIVQTVIPFEDGAGMQLTTAAYYTPNGRSIHKTGVVPDYEAVDNPETEIDEALEFARNWLLERAQGAE